MLFAAAMFKKVSHASMSVVAGWATRTVCSVVARVAVAVFWADAFIAMKKASANSKILFICNLFLN